MERVNIWLVRIAALVFIVGLGVGLMMYLILIKKEPKAQQPPEIIRHVEAQSVKYKTINAMVKAPGRIKSISQVEIVAEAAGRILPGKIPLKKGAGFLKGDVLFTVYPDEAALALKSSKSLFLNTLANMLPDISIDFPDYENVFRTFFSSIELDKDLPDFPEFNDEKLKIFLSNRNVISEYYSIKRDELQLKRHSVKAPFTGTFTDVYLEIGSYTNIGGHVASAIQTDELELEVPLERFDAVWVKIGDKVKIISEKRNLTFLGIVVRKSQFVDENTQSQSIYVRIKNNNSKKILTGEYLIAEFDGHPIKNVMEIPRNAVFNSNEVFLIKNGRLQKETINIVKTNERTLIFNGISIGDTVVTQPLISVQEGVPVVMIGGKKAKNIAEKTMKKNKKLGDDSNKMDKKSNRKKKN